MRSRFLPDSGQLSERAEAFSGDACHQSAARVAVDGARSNLPAWRQSEGMRLRRPRALLLRLLLPFTERQGKVDEALCVAVVVLQAEVEGLRRRVAELESARDGGSQS